MRLTQLAFLGLSLVATACRGGGGDDVGDDDTPDPDGPVAPVEVSIQEVQSDTMPSGTPIELKGVVVTAIDKLGGGSGGFFVSEPEGGALSGVKVFGAALDQVAALAVGDVVNLTSAIKHEACNEAAPCGTIVFDNGASITEVIGAEQGSLVVTKVGTGPLPAPATVDAKAIAALPTREERDAEWEKYEGVLVKVVNGRQLSPVLPFGTMPDADDTEFRLTGFARVQSALFQLPDTLPVGTCYESITGVTDFFFNYIIAPSDENDLVEGGDGCNPLATSISEVQSAATPPELVILDNVFVTGITFDKKSFWVSTTLNATTNNGVFVFGGTGMTVPTLDPAIVPGAKVSLTGAVEEFNDDANGGTLTEIITPKTTVQPDAAGALVPIINQTVAQLMQPAAAAAHESVLVTLTNVNLTAIGNSDNGFIATGVQNGTTFGLATTAKRFVAGDLGCYATYTGLWTNLQAPGMSTTKPNAYGFMPLTPGPKNGVCN